MKIINLKFKISNLKLRHGFTIIELLMSMALISVIAGIGIPVYQSFQVKNDMDVAANTWAQTLRRAQSLAQAVDGDTSWGVRAQPGSLTLFKGTSYAARDADFDESFDVPGAVAISGLTELVFAKFTGYPQSTGTTIFTASTNETRSIAINSRGGLTFSN